MGELRKYQTDMVLAVRSSLAAGAKSVIAVLATGGGKSRIMAEIVRLAVLKGNRCLFLVHRRGLVNQFYDTCLEHGAEAGKIMAGEETNLAAPVQVATIQTFARRTKLVDSFGCQPFLVESQVVLIDECFTGSTMVSTPGGEKRIDMVRCGDVVLCQTGFGVVESIFTKPIAENLYLVELDNGKTIECTGDHPFFTGTGWQEAKRLEIGSYLFSVEGMSLLWENLQAISGGVGWEGRKNQKGLLHGKELEQSSFLLGIVCEESGKSDEIQIKQGEDEKNSEKDWAQTYTERRERASSSFAAIGSLARDGLWMGSRISDKDWHEQKLGLSHVLQAGYRKRRTEDSNRDRRVVSWDRREEEQRRQKDKISFFPRVVNISSIEPKGTVPVFNLRVSGHPSYFADGVAVHNCHRACSKQYKEAIDYYREKGAIIIGFTATAARGDGRPLGDVFEKLVQVIDVQELTDLGYLSPCRYFAPSSPGLDDVKIVRGDYDVSALDKKMNQVKLVGDVVENWLRLASGRKTIVFAVSVAHSKALSAEFNRHGIPAYHLQASSSDEQREYAFQEMERGNIQVICNVALYQEGTDVPAVSCIVLARPTKNLGLYRQMAGRGLRPVPGKELYLLDHGGCIEENGLLTDPIEWTLEGKEKAWRKAKGKEPKEQKDSICSSCALIFSGSKKCPTCGSEAKSFGKKVETLTGDLEEIGGKKKATMEEKIRFYGMLLYYGRAKGFKSGWSYWKYKERFGVAPKNGLHPPEIAPDEAFYSWMKHLVIKYQKGKERAANVGAN